MESIELNIGRRIQAIRVRRRMTQRRLLGDSSDLSAGHPTNGGKLSADETTFQRI